MPTTRAAWDADAMARTSCPEPQPGTSMLPRNGPRRAIHSKSGGAGAPFSHGVSPVRYLCSQLILEFQQCEACRLRIMVMSLRSKCPVGREQRLDQKVDSNRADKQTGQPE